MFAGAPILKHPDPEQPLINKVDSSELGVEAIRLQHFGDRPKLHQKKINYDWELLTIKLSLLTQLNPQRKESEAPEPILPPIC